ncbi:MAG TPA: serine/threonine-protein kinase, partial [Kofleriaceae bacterium]
MSENPPDGTQHVPDGPAPATETQFVPDGTQVPSTQTQFVPDGTLVAKPGVREPSSPSSPWARPGDQTQHVADLPRFGRFRALAELGTGAMGTVYRAQDEVLGRAVAIKALHSRDKGTRERFLREARAIGAVLHPNILAVYDAGTDDQQPYLVMELAVGGSLRERINAGPLPIETVREIGIQIARALAAAHAANILHRDVKPANILAAGDVWKLADFGIARLPDSTLTVEGQFLGSPSYAAPESLRAGEFSAASDVYGLGATLYEALAGGPPHGDHDMAALLRKLEAPPPPLRERRA